MAGFSFDLRETRSAAARRVGGTYLIVCAFAGAAAVLAACTAPKYGEAPSGATYSTTNPIRFGRSAISSPAAAVKAAGTPEESDATSPPGVGAGENHVQVVPIVQAAPGSVPVPEKAPQRAEAAVAPPSPPRPTEAEMIAARRHKPGELVGMAPDGIRKLLGDPALVRQDAPAEIWQYRGRDCVLDLFLYPPAKSGKAHGAKGPAPRADRSVSYYELRGMNGKKLSDDSCFISLIAAALAARSG